MYTMDYYHKKERIWARSNEVDELRAYYMELSITSHQSEWPLSENLQTINAGEGVEKGNTFAPLV